MIVVEGRADVLNLLKHGFKNAIASNGSNCPKTIINLSKEKSVTLFVDGDRGGDLNIKNMLSSAEIDYVIKAADVKEVEELTQKEIHKALRSKIAAEQMKLEFQKARNHKNPKHQQGISMGQGVAQAPPGAGPTAIRPNEPLTYLSTSSTSGKGGE